MPAATVVDLNADLGERDELTDEDLAVIEAVTSVSIACGFHAGSPEVMRDTALACAERGVVVGAHVSYRDRAGFGRRTLDVDPEALVADVIEQYRALEAELTPVGIGIAFVKPHGALYNDMFRKPDHGAALIDAMLRVGSSVLVAQGLGMIGDLPSSAGIRIAHEGFPDRGYRNDGTLAPRGEPGAVIHDMSEAARRAVSLATSGRIHSLDGTPLEIQVETLCVHGDSPDAGLRAARVRAALERAGVLVAPFAGGGPPRDRLPAGRDARAAVTRVARTRVARTRVARLGDRAAAIEAGGTGLAHPLAAALEAVDGIEEVVVGIDSVVVATSQPVSTALLGALGRVDARQVREAPRTEEVVIPTRFDGADFDEVAQITGLTRPGLVELMCSAPLTVAFVGFAPGFPYLTGLPDLLAALPRRSSPRKSVPAGSVAIAGGFAGIYPSRSPGGWHLLGTTTTVMFDPYSEPYSTLRAGDRVRFSEDVRHGASPRAQSRQVAAEGAGGGPAAEVLRPGTLALVQGAARKGVAAIGVPLGGPADRATMILANRLVGNHDRAGALEITGAGPTLRVVADARFALVGMCSAAGDWRVDGRTMPADTVIEVGAGQIIDVSAPRRGLRVYLAVAGGFEPPGVFGSVSSDTLCGLGPGPLQQGAVLPVGKPGRARGHLRHRSCDGRAGPLRLLPGPHLLGTAALDGLCSGNWTVAAESSRVGLRLASAGTPLPGGEVPSMGMVTGAVQIPPGGTPIVLGVDHGTTGGYMVAGCVIDADLDRLGQLAPGDPVEFVRVDADDALAASRTRERELDEAVSGWFPSLAGH
jgi:KipI family sensor histidine kinase inhibitor